MCAFLRSIDKLMGELRKSDFRNWLELGDGMRNLSVSTRRALKSSNVGDCTEDERDLARLPSDVADFGGFSFSAFSVLSNPKSGTTRFFNGFGMPLVARAGGGGVGWGVVGKSDSKENPKSDLDLDLGFVNV